MVSNEAPQGRWLEGAQAAICLTFDNMGEAADLNRNLWPSSQAIGSHYSVTKMLPRFLQMASYYSIPITYFAESWNLGVYPEAIKRIADEGHEVAWHAWQHERWSVECKDESDERRNFERSFGREEGIAGFLDAGGRGEGSKVQRYRGFRPPGGVIHGERTLKMCREYGLGYISPAAEEGALVPIDGGDDSIVVLPFRWKTVDAYYYMEAFSGLRKAKGELPEQPVSPRILSSEYIRQIDETIAKGGFLSLLFHPFLTDQDDRLSAMNEVLRHLTKRRAEGKVWLARCSDVEAWIRAHPDVVGDDPQWDDSTWEGAVSKGQ